MSIEDLDRVMRDAVSNTTPEPPPAEPETPPPPPVQPEPPPSPPPEAPGGEQAPVDELELLRAKLAEQEAHSKHWEQVASRHAGRMGYLEQQLAELRTAHVGRPRREPDDDSGEDADAPVRVSSTPPPSPDKFGAWAVQRAIRDAGAEYVHQHPDYAEHIPKLSEYLVSIGYTSDALLTTSDPAAAERETIGLLREHHLHVQKERAAAHQKEMVERKAQQTAAQAKAKQQASPSASGSAPPPKPGPKAYKDMTLDELDQAMAQGTGGRW